MAADMVPLAGNPTMLRAAADEHLETAESIRRAASSLRDLANRIKTRSLAVDVVRDVANDASDLIVKAEIRYSGTSWALRTYSFALESAQTKANNAIAASSSNQGDLNTARYYMADAEERAQRDTPERLQAIEDYSRWKQRVRDLEAQIATAEGNYMTAVTELNDAAQIAIDSINAAIEKSGLNDSILDRLREAWDALCEYWEEFIAPILSVIQEIVKFLAEVAGWLALILAFFPGMQLIAGALALIALALHGLSLLLTLVLMLSGDRSLGDLIMDVLDVVLAAIPVAGKFTSSVGKSVIEGIAEEMVEGGLKHVIIELGVEMVIEIGVGGTANDIDKVIEAISTGDWEDLPMPGPLPIGSELHLISGVDAWNFDGISIEIPGVLTDNVPTVGDFLDGIRGDFLDGVGASVAAGMPSFATSPFASAR